MYFPNGAIAKTAACYALLQRCVEARSMGRRAIVIPLMKQEPAGASRSARTKHDCRDRKTNSRELGLSMDIQFDLQANRAYMAATHRSGVLRRIVGGPHGRRPDKRSHRRALDPARPANRGCCAYAHRRQQ